MPINSRQKGARAEREFANLLKAHGFEARRGQQFSGSPDSPDVVCESLPFHFEVKHVERLNVYNAMEQSASECGDKAPVVAHKRNRQPWLVTMTFQDFIALMKEPEDE